MISVIIPVYNASNTIRRTVESVEAQTYKNFEVILINDGSTDDSLKVCESLNKEYTNIVIINQENLGASVARNVGVLKAIGDWICFVDADDILPDDAFEIMREVATDRVDIVVGCNGDLDSDSTKEYCDCEAIEFVKATLSPEYAVKLQKEKLQSKQGVCVGPPWGKLIKRSLLIKNNITFPEGQAHHEDTIFCLQMYMSTEIVRFVYGRVYNYIDTVDSVSVRYNPNKVENMRVVIDRACKLSQSYSGNITSELNHFIFSRVKDCFFGYVTHVNNNRGILYLIKEIKSLEKINEVELAIKELTCKAISSKQEKILLAILKLHGSHFAVAICRLWRRCKLLR